MRDSTVKIRPAKKEDRDQIVGILRRTGNFTEEEIRIAEELLDAYFASSTESGYWTYTAELNKIVGYICYGPTPLTSGTFDIYWIAVDPDVQGKHIGTELLSFAEDDIVHHNGRLITVYTSSQEKYRNTRAFYSRRGYREGCRIKDYYKPGDDLVIYVKLTLED
ncbi:MAG: GNAT family N-acetyltransferase [Candidatus Kryptoniota bacterium]